MHMGILINKIKILKNHELYIFEFSYKVDGCQTSINSSITNIVIIV